MIHNISSCVMEYVEENNSCNVLIIDLVYTLLLNPILCPVKIYCNIFSPSFLQRGHQLIHSGVQPYSSNVCNKWFTAKPSLKAHLLVHSGACPFSCDVCNKSFRLQGTLKTHQHIHSGVRPFICHMCVISLSVSKAI
jgi:hypothetical protein